MNFGSTYLVENLQTVASINENPKEDPEEDLISKELKEDPIAEVPKVYPKVYSILRRNLSLRAQDP